MLGMEVHACNPSTEEAEAKGSPRIQGQPGLPEQVQGETVLRGETLPHKHEIKEVELKVR